MNPLFIIIYGSNPPALYYHIYVCTEYSVLTSTADRIRRLKRFSTLCKKKTDEMPTGLVTVSHPRCRPLKVIITEEVIIAAERSIHASTFPFTAQRRHGREPPREKKKKRGGVAHMAKGATKPETNEPKYTMETKKRQIGIIADRYVRSRAPVTVNRDSHMLIRYGG
jgi:hypothetical protein